MKRNPITNAVQKALFTGFVASSAFGTVALAQDDNDESVEEQGKITVTGSRIKRSDVEGALPVTVISREQIELSGESSAADFIRNLTFNSTGSFRPQSGSSAQGTAAVSLRGLGSSRTLVLVDGRRLAKSPSTGGDQDLNIIPAGAIERIEILSDGASAVYGSDAIGGVINVITRTDFQGAEVMLGGAEVSIPKNGGERSEGSIVFGAAGDRGSLIAGMSWNDREIVFARDFPWTEPGNSTYGNNWFNPNVGIVGLPGGCNFPGTGYFQNGARCAYNFTLVSADDASTDNQSFYAKARYEVNDNWELWMNTTASETESFGRYAPVPDYAYLDPSSPNNPTNPASPFYDPAEGLDPQVALIFHRFDALGNRDGTVTNKLTNIQFGTTGQVGKVTVDAGVSRSNNRTFDIGNNYLLRSAALGYLNSGEYMLNNPYGAAEEVLNGMSVTISRIGTYDQDEIFGSVSFDLFDMANGPVSVALGAEYREDKFSDQYDSLSEAGQVGGSAGNSAAGTRDITSLYFEALFPFLDNLEMTLAGRYDDYSDYGSDFSPKVSFRYQPMENLTLRASYGQGFRAPDLPSLYGKRAFSAESVADPASCLANGEDEDCTLQVTAFSIGNPNLESETSDQYSFGVAYEPLDWFNLTLDYYNIEIDNRLRSFSPTYLLQLESEGIAPPPGLGITRNPLTGAITNIDYGPGNQGTYENSGIDLNLRFSYDLFGGQMTNNFQMSQLLDVSIDGGRDRTSDPGVPERRVVLSNVWSYGDWSFAYNLNMIGDQYDDVYTDSTTGRIVKEGHVPTWVTHDVQANYHAPWNGKFTVGVRNAGEKYPPINLGAFGSREYDYFLYDGYGRVTYFRYTQTF